MADDREGQENTPQQPHAVPAAISSEMASKRFLGFTGSFSHGIDAKGRMIVPATFREHLGAQFVTGLTLDFKAIALYPAEEWLKQQAMLDELKAKDIRVQALIDQVSKYSYTDSETDAQGRLLLPQKLRTLILGDAREVEVSGARTHIRVVESALGEKEDADFRAMVPDVLSFIAQIQQK